MPRTGAGADWMRFLIAGAANTLLTLCIFQLLLFLLPSQEAYALIWLFSLGAVVLFYPSQVFRGGRTDGRAPARLGLTYIAVFLVGSATLEGLKSVGIAPRLAIVFVVLETGRANFFLARLTLRGKPRLGVRNRSDKALVAPSEER
jgi:hypothetical protein